MTNTWKAIKRNEVMKFEEKYIDIEIFFIKGFYTQANIEGSLSNTELSYSFCVYTHCAG